MENLDERLRKLEEALAFADHADDQVAAELRRASEAIERLNRRLAALEARLAAIGRTTGDAPESA